MLFNGETLGMSFNEDFWGCHLIKRLLGMSFNEETFGDVI
jgi:hypothetical protein